MKISFTFTQSDFAGGKSEWRMGPYRVGSYEEAEVLQGEVAKMIGWTEPKWWQWWRWDDFPRRLNVRATK